MIKYNTDKLIKVECHDFTQSLHYSYLKEKKSFWGSTKKEGVYHNIFDYYMEPEELEYYTIKDGKVFENPVVILHYQNDISKSYYFDDFESAKRFADNLTNDRKWIN
jgi:hypothetical protein